MLKRISVVAAVLALPAAAAAQDFGTGWVDRVTNEVQQERAPQNPKPLVWSAFAGTALYHDNNLFLTETDEEKSAVIIPFVRGRLDYAAPHYDVQADLMANYKFYTTDHDLDDNEERAYLHFRQVGPNYSLEIAEILQHVSDPSNAVFFERVERLVATTIPKATFDITRALSVEARADYQIVRFRDSSVDEFLDNDFTRADLTFVWRTAIGMDLLAQGGYQNIDYRKGQDSGAPPDAFGSYWRLGLRGEVLPSLHLEVIGGYTTIETDYYIGTTTDDEDDDLDASLLIRYELTETVNVNANYSRLYTFAGGADAWQLINRFILGAEWTVLEGLVLRVRGQFDRTDSQQGTDREFLSGSLGGDWRATEWLAFDAGVTFRRGETVFDNESDTDFSNLIFSLGFALIY